MFIYSGGGSYPNYTNEILEFHPDTEDWSLAGHMTRATSGHAVSTINFEDVQDFCVVWADEGCDFKIYLRDI